MTDQERQERHGRAKKLWDQLEVIKRRDQHRLSAKFRLRVASIERARDIGDLDRAEREFKEADEFCLCEEIKVLAIAKGAHAVIAAHELMDKGKYDEAMELVLS